MEEFNLSAVIISGVAVVSSVVLGFVATKYKSRYNQVLDLLTYALGAAKDGKLTTEEIDGILSRVNTIRGEGDK